MNDYIITQNIMGKVNKNKLKSTNVEQNGKSPIAKNKFTKNVVKSDIIFKKATDGTIKKAKETAKNDNRKQKNIKPGVASTKPNKSAIFNESFDLNSVATIKKSNGINSTPPKSKRKKSKKPKNTETNILIQDNHKEESIEENDTNVGSLLRISNSNKPQYEKNVIESAVDGILKLRAKFETRKKQLFDGEVPILLQICLIKVPETPTRTIRIPLMYSTYSDNSEICLVTPDLKNTNLKDYDKNIQHHEQLLEKNNITNIKTIIPYHQLRNDYSETESKMRFVDLYDVILVDAKIHGYVMHKFMGVFYKKHKMPLCIRLHAPNLKLQFEKVLLKTVLPIHPKGDSFVVKVGHTSMKKEHIVANVEELLDSFDCHLPGGFDNIRRLDLKTAQGMSIPIYMNLKPKSEVEVPVVKSKRPKAAKRVRGELSTVIGADVTVDPSGKVIVHNTGEVDEDDKINFKQLKIKQVVEDNIDDDDSNDEEEAVSKEEEQYLNTIAEERLVKKKKKVEKKASGVKPGKVPEKNNKIIKELKKKKKNKAK